MVNLLSFKNNPQTAFNPFSIAQVIRNNYQKRRLELNITQKELSLRSGVSLGSIKRFETKAEILLKHLLRLAIVLEASEQFHLLFAIKHFRSIEEVVAASRVNHRKRARTND